MPQVAEAKPARGKEGADKHLALLFSVKRGGVRPGAETRPLCSGKSCPPGKRRSYTDLPSPNLTALPRIPNS